MMYYMAVDYVSPCEVVELSYVDGYAEPLAEGFSLNVLLKASNDGGDFSRGVIYRARFWSKSGNIKSLQLPEHDPYLSVARSDLPERSGGRIQPNMMFDGRVARGGVLYFTRAEAQQHCDKLQAGL